MTQPVEVEEREFVCEGEIRLGDLNTAIKVRVYRRISDSKIIVVQSHFLKTAIQYLPYAVHEMSQAEPSAALKELERTLVHFYEQAVRRGYTPSDSWLVPNTSYNSSKCM
ncbi:MAG TPA: hypothetical protein VMT82_08495 [candidate division Zixibacteria bacterium]|nr:hypothetical protein [Candidatus Acidoferrales bacterium]HVP64921.1 hypothetical protein [candidate division Zixibacteria bacterium]